MDDHIIIFVEGVFKSDIALDGYVFDTSDSSDDDESPYDEIPLEFTDINKWITKTNILCGYCGLSHNNPPVLIPHYITYCNGQLIIKLVRLLFCSFPCAAKYINITYSGHEKYVKKSELKKVYNIFTGENIDDFPLSPDKTEIDIFGGKYATYTVERYKRFVNSLILINNYLISNS